MARIRPAKGQGRSGDGPTPPPGGARPPAKRAQRGAQSPKPNPPGQRRKPDKAGSVTKAVVQQRRGSRFITEVIAELRKVSWPDRATLMQSTAVVLVVVAIVSVYLAALDAVFSRLIDAIF